MESERPQETHRPETAVFGKPSRQAADRDTRHRSHVCAGGGSVHAVAQVFLGDRDCPRELAVLVFAGAPSIIGLHRQTEARWHAVYTLVSGDCRSRRGSLSLNAGRKRADAHDEVCSLRSMQRNEVEIGRFQGLADAAQLERMPLHTCSIRFHRQHVPVLCPLQVQISIRRQQANPSVEGHGPTADGRQEGSAERDVDPKRARVPGRVHPK